MQNRRSFMRKILGGVAALLAIPTRERNSFPVGSSGQSLVTNGSGYLCWGGPSSMWGQNWTPADVNRADFGVNFCHAKNFGFNIPANARIDGITVEIAYQVKE